MHINYRIYPKDNEIDGIIAKIRRENPELIDS